jgi:hypothetical protein
MIVRTVLSTKRRGSTVAVALLLASACTSMLGIDGEYSASPVKNNEAVASGGKEPGSGGPVILPTGGTGADMPQTGSTPGFAGAHPGGSSAVPDASVGRGGVSAGGSPSGSGGASGGSSNDGSGGRAPSGGGASGTGGAGVVPEPDATAPECPTGTYAGTYRGTHKPGTPVSVLSAPISGSITLRFTATSGTSAMITGGFLDPLTDSTGGVAGTIRGTFDCAKGVGSATLSTAEVTTVVPIVYVATVEGTIEIKSASSGMLNGTFTVQETMNTSGTGGGTWSAGPAG